MTFNIPWTPSITTIWWNLYAHSYTHIRYMGHTMELNGSHVLIKNTIRFNWFLTKKLVKSCKSFRKIIKINKLENFQRFWTFFWTRWNSFAISWNSNLFAHKLSSLLVFELWKKKQSKWNNNVLLLILIKSSQIQWSRPIHTKLNVL